MTKTAMQDRVNRPGHQPAKPAGLISRLRRSRSGNTLFLTAAMAVPLIGMAGVAIDLGRAYLGKERLQTACDSAALAIRRKIGTNSVMTEADKDFGKAYFYQNFPKDYLGSADLKFDAKWTTEGDVQKVMVKASMKSPQLVAGVIGASQTPINVSCESVQNLVSTDIMLVLDVTGSMNCAPNQPAGSRCSTGVTRNGQYTQPNGSKMTFLVDAIKILYDQLDSYQTSLETHGRYLRYGVLPFSSAVNVGNLIREENDDFMPDVGIFNASNNDLLNPNSSLTYKRKYWKNDNPNGSLGWNGCVIEPATVVLTEKNGNQDKYTSIPDEAYDLQINAIPERYRQMWQPYIPEKMSNLVNSNVYNNMQTACPDKATHLDSYDSQSELIDKIKSVKADGGTLSDLGILWGARMLSDKGIFAKSPLKDSYDGKVAKHIVLVSDGAIDAGAYLFSAYGLAAGGYPRLGTTDNVKLTAEHRRRFLWLCERVKKDMGITIWTIGFGSSAAAAKGELQACATSPRHWASAESSEELQSTMRKIAADVSGLRITS